MNNENDGIEIEITENNDNNLENLFSDKLKTEIIKNHIEPSYRKDVISLIDGKKCWRNSGQIFETISKVCVAIGGVVSFAAGYYDEKFLSFISGAISVFSLAALQFSAFSFKENKKQSQELNILLKKLNIESMPVLGRNVNSIAVSSTNDNNFENTAEPKISLIEYNRLLTEFEEFKRNAYQKGAELTKELETIKEKDKKEKREKPWK